MGILDRIINLFQGYNWLIIPAAFLAVVFHEISHGFVKNINDFVKLGDKVKLKIIEVEEDQKRYKLSYKLVNKIRGIKGDVPKYTIGFKSLRDRMPQFIKEQEKMI